MRLQICPTSSGVVHATSILVNNGQLWAAVFTARRYASAIVLSTCVRPSVRHTPVLYQNGKT